MPQRFSRFPRQEGSVCKYSKRGRLYAALLAAVLLAASVSVWPPAARADGARLLLEAPEAAEARVELVLLARREVLASSTLHSKAAVIDGETAIVGSFNLDPRSEHLNTELALVARDPALAAELLAWMDAHLGSAVRIDRRGWPEGADGPFPGVPCAKVAKLRLLQLLAPFIRKQL